MYCFLIPSNQLWILIDVTAVLMLCVQSVDRLIAICHPTWYIIGHWCAQRTHSHTGTDGRAASMRWVCVRVRTRGDGANT